jgi:hypothetical protein
LEIKITCRRCHAEQRTFPRFLFRGTLVALAVASADSVESVSSGRDHAEPITWLRDTGACDVNVAGFCHFPYNLLLRRNDYVFACISESRRAKRD